MRARRYLLLVGFSIAFPSLLTGQDSRPHSSINALGISVTGASREFAYTNKRNAFYYGETHASHNNPWHGFHVARRKVFHDYSLLIDGIPLPRSEAVQVIVYPDYIERTYANGVREQLRLVDSLSMFAIHLSSPIPVEIGFIPWIPGIRDSSDHWLRLYREGASIGVPAQPTTWVAFHGNGIAPVAHPSRGYDYYSSLFLVSPRNKEHSIAFATSASEDEARQLATLYGHSADRFSEQRRKRMEELLELTTVETGDKSFNTALSWAKLSLDALIMDDERKGIYAGLPLFNNYWGRDTFISLPGALLVTGHFREAKEILRTFIGRQETDAGSSNYGRIPNFISHGEASYNTADGTPRFVVAAKEYVERSGDTLFLAEVYPSILRAIDGTIRFHMDSLGFLTHEDSETWMDAAGPRGPWSPRGNRANDIQALWSAQLDAGIWFATHVGDAMSAQSWQSVNRMLKENFRTYFLMNNVVTDHLNRDGSPDHQVRPNQIFTTALLREHERASVVATIVRELTYPYGVASLSQKDPGFHPFHVHPPFYPKDAAYHNGTVWTWLQGRVISELCAFGRENTAVTLTQNAVHQILHRGAVGTQSELLDAIPVQRDSQPRISGTFSQAWNLAEFIRNFYDDYLGVRMDRFNHLLTLQPRLPEILGDVHAVINLDGRSVPLTIRRTAEVFDITIDATNLRKRGRGEIVIPLPGSTESARVEIGITPGKRIKLSASKAGVLMLSDGETEIVNHQTTPTLSELLPKDLRFATAAVSENLPALKAPEHLLLSHETIKRKNPQAKMFVVAEDPAGDDVGSGWFTYPSHPAHLDGSFDLAAFHVDFDDRNLYFRMKFRALSNPGWHPEYGFQLTLAAIAIDSDNTPKREGSSIGHNSRFIPPIGFHPDRIILVGGGIQVEDGEGRVLAAYVPAPGDVTDPLGNAADGTISFALPRDILDTLNPDWRVLVLVGGQDDHGGAGIGEFRSVGQEAGEWHGGGRISDLDANVYDTLIYPPDRGR